MTRSLLGPFIEDRLKTVELAKQGLAEMPNDAIVWLHEVANGQPYDPVTVQLGVSVTAIHTTTDLLTQTLLDLVAHPEIIGPLRKEIEDVVAEVGWGKTTLQKMILLDSVVKETQRLKPASGGKCFPHDCLRTRSFLTLSQLLQADTRGAKSHYLTGSWYRKAPLHFPRCNGCGTPNTIPITRGGTAIAFTTCARSPAKKPSASLSPRARSTWASAMESMLVRDASWPPMRSRSS